jgi:hypothetical protein
MFNRFAAAVATNQHTEYERSDKNAGFVEPAQSVAIAESVRSNDSGELLQGRRIWSRLKPQLEKVEEVLQHFCT